MTPRIAVSGASGHLGGGVAARLAEAGIEQRLLVRSPERAPRLGRSEVALADYADATTCAAALAGIDTVFMVSGAEEPDRTAAHRTFVDAARSAGVRRIVYTSFLGASPTATFTLARDHWDTEQHIRSTGLLFTFLRDNLYADQLPLFAGSDGVLLGPGGDGRVSAVARRDVADVAAAVLLAADSRHRSEHDGRTYDLTGPQALSLAEAARIITEVTGRPTRYQNQTLAEAYASRRGYGAPDWQLDAWVSTYTAIAVGELAAVTADVQAVAGHPATSLRELLSAR